MVVLTVVRRTISPATLSLPHVCRVGRSPVQVVLLAAAAKALGWTLLFPPLATELGVAPATRRRVVATPLLLLPHHE